MARRTVFLLPAEDVGWDHIRAALVLFPDVEVVGEATNAWDALQMLAGRPSPDVFLVSERVERVPITLLVEVLRTCWPESEIVVFASGWRSVDELVALFDQRVLVYLWWPELPHEMLYSHLGFLTAGGFMVWSTTPSDLLWQELARQQRGQDVPPSGASA